MHRLEEAIDELDRDPYALEPLVGHERDDGVEGKASPHRARHAQRRLVETPRPERIDGSGVGGGCREHDLEGDPLAPEPDGRAQRFDGEHG